MVRAPSDHKLDMAFSRGLNKNVGQFRIIQPSLQGFHQKDLIGRNFVVRFLHLPKQNRAADDSKVRPARAVHYVPNDTGEEHQQALFTAMKNRMLSPSSFVRLPWIAWNTPPAIISDMSGLELLGLFGALATAGTPPTRVLEPTGHATLPDGGEGLTVTPAARQAAVARLMAG